VEAIQRVMAIMRGTVTRVTEPTQLSNRMVMATPMMLRKLEMSWVALWLNTVLTFLHVIGEAAHELAVGALVGRSAGRAAAGGQRDRGESRARSPGTR
jgi:hypothetical protein